MAAQGDLFGLPPDAPQPAPTDAPAGAGDSRFAIHDSPVAGKAGYDAQRRRQIALYAADRAGDPNFANKGILIGQAETAYTPYLNARMKGLSRTAARAKEAPGCRMSIELRRARGMVCRMRMGQGAFRGERG